MAATELLYSLASAADANVVGCAVLRPDRAAEEGWHVVERPDGVRVRLDTADGVPPNAAAIAAVTGADLVALALAPARAEKLAALAAWAKQWTATVSGVTLRANEEAQANFTRQTLSVLIGAPAWVIDTSGVKHDLTRDAYLALMAAYAGECQSLMLAYYAAEAAIRAAQTAAELDAVTWG